MKVKCLTSEEPSFTLGKVYDVIEVDAEGDIWVNDDEDCQFFFYPEEREVVEE